MEKIIIPALSHEYGNSIYDTTYAYQFNEAEFNLIFPLMLKSINKKLTALSKKIEHYEGLKETAATDRQLAKLFEYQEQYDLFMLIKKTLNK
ncbi:MAG: hypothetical protein LBP63_11100 [Prevotellaceae bacterium]|jgi:hypothetical protein|nr:hypothetical protein [Prevotellaceae bacterium]